MTSVTIVPIAVENGGTMYRAICGQHQSSGTTAGAALDALNMQLANDQRGTLVVVQDRRPDLLFPAESQARLRELMAEWNQSRVLGTPFDTSRKAELESLVDAELAAAAQRAANAIQEADA
jgi:hypothetical protein